MTRVVYICSLSHSGSTALSLLLATHSKVVSLGEVEATYYRGTGGRVACTCGAHYSDCPFWNSVDLDVSGGRNVPGMEDFYRKIVNRGLHYASEHGTQLLCDSSKTISGLKQWQTFKEVDLKVILLVKDIRSYLLSQTKRRSRADKRKKDGPSGLILNRTPVLALRWKVSNYRILKLLLEEKMDYLLLGYEELCLRTDKAMQSIYRFLGLAEEEGALQLARERSGVHMIRGNKMRHDPEASAVVRYDYRWMTSGAWLNLNAMPYLKVNNKLVYSNGSFD